MLKNMISVIMKHGFSFLTLYQINRKASSYFSERINLYICYEKVCFYPCRGFISPIFL